MSKAEEHEQQVANAHRAALKAVYQHAVQAGKRQFFVQLLGCDLTPEQMRKAVDLAPPDNDGADVARRAKATAFAVTQSEKQRERQEQQRQEDEKARIAAERHWAQLHGLPQTPDYRTPAEKQQHDTFAAMARGVARGRDFETERDLMQAGAAAASRLRGHALGAPQADHLRALAERANAKG